MKHTALSAVLFGETPAARKRTVGAILTAVLLLVLIGLNLAFSCLPTALSSPDLSGSDTFTVSGKSLDWLKTVDEEITVYFLCDGGKTAADGDLYAFLKRYEEASDRITLQIVDTSADADFIDRFGGELPNDQSVIVQSARRYRIIDNTELYYYYNAYVGLRMTADEYASYLSAYQSGATSSSVYSYGYMLYTYADNTSAYFNGESHLTNAIRFVTMERVPVVGVLVASNASMIDSSLREHLILNHCELRVVSNTQSIPADCDVLIFHAPLSDLTAADAASLSSYLERGGDLLLTTSYFSKKMPNLTSLLASYGLSAPETSHIVCEGSSMYQLSDSAYPYMMKARIGQTAASADFSGSFVALYPHAITVTETEGVNVTPFLYTSAQGYLREYQETDGSYTDQDARGVYNYGVIAEKNGSQVLWLSSPEMLSSVANRYAEGGNFDLILSTVYVMAEQSHEPISVEAKQITTQALSVSVSAFAACAVVLVILLPVALIVVGCVIRYTRKKR